MMDMLCQILGLNGKTTTLIDFIKLPTCLNSPNIRELDPVPVILSDRRKTPSWIDAKLCQKM